MIGSLSSLVTPANPLPRPSPDRNFLLDLPAARQTPDVHKLAFQLSITQNPNHAQTPPSSLDSNRRFAAPFLPRHLPLAPRTSKYPMSKIPKSEANREALRIGNPSESGRNESGPPRCESASTANRDLVASLPRSSFPKGGIEGGFVSGCLPLVLGLPWRATALNAMKGKSNGFGFRISVAGIHR